MSTHNLIDILTVPDGEGVNIVVRWCKDCGSSVVDRDIDGQTMPAALAPMRRPKGTQGLGGIGKHCLEK